ncbi:MAG: RNA-binding transcriptional accessory protein [Candidatus Brocadiaceae bacterium]|nr:RNA-binding transcriptional accessory protein [Candidatus Brocadiaceae bacterium]
MTSISENSILLKIISVDSSVSQQQVSSTLTLLEGGNTVPFIARYRKEITGNIDEVKIRTIDEKRIYFKELLDRKDVILKTIEEQKKLTPELKAKIEGCYEKSELEDLYLPFKPKRKTKATVAMEKGLEPLATFLYKQETGKKSTEELAAEFVNQEKGVHSVEEALEGALHIIAEWIAENATFRKHLREMMLKNGILSSRVLKGKEGTKSKFEMYYDFKEPVATIPSHRILAIRRGAEEGILAFFIEIEAENILHYLKEQVIKTPHSSFAPYLESAIKDCYTRLLNTSIQTEVRLLLKKRADEEAIAVFRENLENLLLSPPAGPKTVIGIDPGLRTGCKVAVVGSTGKLLEHATIYPTEPKNDIAGATKSLLTLINKYHVEAISIGNGTASRETESFIKKLLKEQNTGDVFSIIVNEAGASIYSASDIAREEFPDLDLTIRGAISIARRLQDPLAELVKIDPKSIGVGQYQHDVDQKKLKEGLEETVESCVNRVGVDLNTASYALLRYVAGINETVAKRIIQYREKSGPFDSRTKLLQISGFGEKTFQQSAGFLRIRGGMNPLDGTAVHPESYYIVECIAASLGITLAGLIENSNIIQTMNFDQFTDEKTGMYTLNDIREELLRPGRDPREKFVTASFREDVLDITDLTNGMELEGVVTNVTNFGAFVDVGVHQDGLIHISELSHTFIKVPSEAVKVGELVKVMVLSVDVPMKRIALSRKALLPLTGKKEIQKRKHLKTIADQIKTFKEKYERK